MHDGLLARICPDDDKLKVAPKAVSTRELHDVIGIGIARGLRKETQGAGNGMVLMT